MVRQIPRQMVHRPHPRPFQRVAFGSEAANDMFFEGEPAELRTVDVVGKGRAELAAKNKEWGLALAEEELGYLVSSFGADGLKRNPSDVELMMFAQVNSEHCRHKIFNASWEIDGQAKDLSLFQMIRNTYNLHKEGVLRFEIPVWLRFGATESASARRAPAGQSFPLFPPCCPPFSHFFVPVLGTPGKAGVI